MDVSDARLIYLKRIAQNNLRFRDDKWNRMLDNEEVYELLLNYFEQQDPSKIFLSLDTEDNLRLTQHLPEEFKQRVLYFEKLPGQQKIAREDPRMLFTIYSQQPEDLEQKVYLLFKGVFERIEEDLPEALKQSIEEVFSDLRFRLTTHSSGLMAVDQHLLDALRPQKGLIPLLLLEGNRIEEEDGIESPELFKLAEQYAITWSKAIFEEISKSVCITGFGDELEFWKEKYYSLQVLEQDILRQDTQEVVLFLEKRKSALYGVLLDAVSKIDNALLLAEDACLYLSPLEPLSSNLSFSNVEATTKAFLTALNIILGRAKLYCKETARLQQLARCFFASLVELMRDYLEGPDVLKMDSGDANRKVAAVVVRLQGAYDWFIVWQRENPTISESSVELVILLIRRLEDFGMMLDKWTSLAKLEKFEIGGRNGGAIEEQIESIYQKFTNRLLKWQDADCDPTDVFDSAFDDLEDEFNAMYVEWEKQLLGIFGGVFQQDGSLLFYASVVSQFSDILSGDVVASIIAPNLSNVISKFTAILELEEQELNGYRPTGNISSDIEHLTGLRSHIEEYYDAVKSIMEYLNTDTENSYLRGISTSVGEFHTTINAWIQNLYNGFLVDNNILELLESNIFDIQEVDLPPEEDSISVSRAPLLDIKFQLCINYPVAIEQFFVTMRTLELLHFDLPKNLLRIFGDFGKFEQVSAELSQRVQQFNEAQESLDYISRTLLYKDLGVINTLKQYQPVLHWDSAMSQIFEFLEKLTPIGELSHKTLLLRIYEGKVEKSLRALGQGRLFVKHKGILKLEEIARQIPQQFASIGGVFHTDIFDELSGFLAATEATGAERNNFLLLQQKMIFEGAVELCSGYINKLMECFDECEQHSFCNLFGNANEINEKSLPTIEFVAKLASKSIITDPGLSDKNPNPTLENEVRGVINEIFMVGEHIFDPVDLLDKNISVNRKSISLMLEIDDELSDTTRRVRQYINDRCKEIQQEFNQFNEYQFLFTTNRQRFFELFLKYGPNTSFSLEIEEDKAEMTEVVVRQREVEIKEEVQYYRIPEVDDFEMMIERFDAMAAKIDSEFPNYKRLGWAQVNFRLLKQELQTLAIRYKTMFIKHLTDETVNKLAALESTFELAILVFSDPSSKDFESLLLTYREMKQLESKFETQYTPLKSAVTLMKNYGAEYPDNFEERLEKLPENFSRVRQLRVKIEEYVLSESVKFSQQYAEEYELFSAEISAISEGFLFRPEFTHTDNSIAYQLIDSTAIELCAASTKYNFLEQKLRLFDMMQKRLPEGQAIRTMQTDILLLKELRDVSDAAESSIKSFEKEKLIYANVEVFGQELKDIQRLIKAFGANARRFEHSKFVEARIRKLTRTMGVITALKSPALMSKHFATISSLVGEKVSEESEISVIVNLDTELYEEDILTVAAKAEKEEGILQFISDLEQRWDTFSFSFVKEGDLSGTIVTDEEFERMAGPAYVLMTVSEEIQNELEQDLSILSAMLANRILQDFNNDFSLWQRRLIEVESLIQTWGTSQHIWGYLHPIFLHSIDIQKQLGETTDEFRELHESFVVEERFAFYHAKCVDLAMSEFLQVEERFFNELQEIERSLGEYLTQKRVTFPRFFFLSNSDLLEILSVSSQPKLVERHLPKLTDCESEFIWDNDAIIGCLSSDGGRFSSETKFLPTGPVELWAATYLDFIGNGLHDMLLKAVEAVFDATPRNNFMDSFPLQLILTAIQVHSTAETENALELTAEGDENSLRALLRRRADELAQYIKLIETTTNKVEINRLSSVCTVVVHTRDVVLELTHQKAEGPECFLWERQLRFFCEQDCSVEICDAVFPYTYEFLGNTARLVVTALTEKCYVTLSQALHLMMGGAPAGPAGTGKTETTKDLGKALGRMVYVFNCSPEMDYETTQNIFYGLCTSGSWGCFDEFNRIEANVLSVIAMEVKHVFDRLRAGSETISFTLSDAAQINSNFGYFITMNPGYAGRTELPDNLKALFRSVAMVIPDFKQITEIMLISNGFISAGNLAEKFVTLYELNEELLSNEDHYDWGLRAIIAICRTAGALRREMIK